MSEKPSQSNQAGSLRRRDDEISSVDPWSADALKREDIAKLLTNLVAGEEGPLVISINGQWGTGKTFLLERWRQDLENGGFNAIYFNAWEDDFHDDPLVAIIGQLSDYFGKKAPDLFNEEVLTSLLKSIPFNVAEKITAGMISTENWQQWVRDKILDRYSNQAESKKALKSKLKEISQRENKPLIFIIDELDRCRPTWAIELLERVKHIFDVPYIIFVLGINRQTLCSSIESIYGKVDADVYLRRFFDFEFSLPPGKAEDFCRCLIKKYKSEKRLVYSLLSNKGLPQFYDRLGLSLRDMEDCVQSLLLAEKRAPQGGPHETLGIVLNGIIALKLKYPALYHKFMHRQCPAKDVINYFDKALDTANVNNEKFNHFFDTLEACLYPFDCQSSDDSPLHNPQKEDLLSDRTRGDSQRIERLQKHYVDIPPIYFSQYFDRNFLHQLFELSIPDNR